MRFDFGSHLAKNIVDSKYYTKDEFVECAHTYYCPSNVGLLCTECRAKGWDMEACKECWKKAVEDAKVEFKEGE